MTHGAQLTLPSTSNQQPPLEPLPSEKNLLHFKPISARCMNGIQKAHAFLCKEAPQTGWKGRVVRVLAVSLAVGGYLANMPIALVEAVALGALGVIGGVAHTLTGMKCQTLEKFTIKSFSYSFNSIAVLLIECLALSDLSERTLIIPRNYTHAAILDQITYLGTAALSNFLMAIWFKGLDSEAVKERPLQTLVEGAPNAIVEILQAFINDHAPVSINPINLNQFYTQLSPEQQELLRNFNIRRTLESGYLEQYYPIIASFLAQSNLSTTDINVEVGQNEVTLNKYSKEEKQYQNHLKECVKTAVLKMKENQWTKFLDKENNLRNGSDILESFYPDATIPLAHIAQVMELESETNCPLEFKHKDLTQYNKKNENPSRNTRLATVKKFWTDMNGTDKELLIERLIKGGDFSLGERTLVDKEKWDAVYKDITELASHIHQGKLMSVLTFNLENQDFSSVNLFGKAWQEGVNELA